jgi:hypothetical protein
VGIDASVAVDRGSRFDWLGHIVGGNVGIVVPFFLANHSVSASHSVGNPSWWLLVGGLLGVIVGAIVGVAVVGIVSFFRAIHTTGHGLLWRLSIGGIGGGILGGAGGSSFSFVFGSGSPVFGFFLVLVVIIGGVGGGIVGGRAGARIGRS